MKFTEAQAELEKMADGEYYTLQYEIKSHYSDWKKKRHNKQECTVYIHGGEHISGSTWREALDKMAGEYGKGIAEEQPA